MVVLGMHLSGTSALTEALADAGGRLSHAEQLNPAPGQTEHGPAEHEPAEHGYFQDLRVLELNDWIMTRHGAGWDRPWPMQRARPTELELERVASLWTELEAEGVTLLMDPRFSLTLAWWREAWARTGTLVKIIEIVRHPSQVAASLLSREAIPIAFGELLWKEYLEQAAANSSGETVHRVMHQDLMRDAPAVLRSLGSTLGLGAEETSSGTPALGGSVEAARQHQFTETPPVLWQVRALWAGIRGGSGSSPVGAEAADLQLLADIVLTQLRTSQADAQHTSALQLQLDETAARAAALGSELNRVLAAYAESHEEATRVHAAYAESQSELARVHAAYAETHAELSRVRTAYDASEARLARIRRSLLGRWLDRSS